MSHLFGGTDETGFYITCPSDTPLPPGQKSNTPFHFKIPLASTIKLNGNWQVAVSDIQLPSTYGNPAQNILSGITYDPRLPLQVWIFTEEIPDETTKKRFIATQRYENGSGDYCYDISAKDPVTGNYYDLNTVEDVLRAMERILIFNGKKIMTYERGERRVTVNGWFRVYIYLELVKQMGLRMDPNRIDSLDFIKIRLPTWAEKPRRLWYVLTAPIILFYDGKYLPPKDSPVSLTTIIPFSRIHRVVNLLRENSNPNGLLSKVCIKKWRTQTNPDGSKTIVTAYAYGDILNYLKRIFRRYGDYTAEEIFEAVTKTLQSVETDIFERQSYDMGSFWEIEKNRQVILPTAIAKVLGLATQPLKLNKYELAVDNAPYPPEFWFPVNVGSDSAITRIDFFANPADKYKKVTLFTQPRTIPFKTYSTQFHSIYINTDIVEPHPVGNVNANVLRVLKLSDGQTFIKEEFPIRHYYNLRVNEFNSITIAITTDTGDKIPINYGVVSLTLHFRKVGS